MLQANSKKPLRPLWFLAALFAVLVLWTIAVFQYGSHNWAVFRVGVWVPPLNFKYQLEQAIHAWREHIVIIVGIIVFSFTPICRNVLRPKNPITQSNQIWLMVFLVAMYALFAWDQYQLESAWFLETQAKVLSSERSNYGLLFVALAGLLGGWRIGLAIGILNMVVLSGIGHSVFFAANGEPLITTILMQLWAVTGVVVGIGCGYWREITKLEFKPWVLLLLGTLFEITATTTTLVTTWSAPYHFDRFTHNLLATGPLLALLGWWLQRQANNDPQALQLTQSELTLVQAELRALRAQMNPHFLINSLSVIHHLVRSDPERARALLLDLSDVLQHTLRAGNFVTLEQEIEQTKAYLALEQARYTNRLEVEWDVSIHTNLHRAVPTLTLQPLVENAVQHGIAPRAEGGTVRVLIQETSEGLTIQVIDNGVGFEAKQLPVTKVNSTDNHNHIALMNIAQRLQLIYGKQYGLQIQSKLEQGTTVTVRLPPYQGKHDTRTLILNTHR